jgi:hypothetical protein
MPSEDPDERVREGAISRQHERAERVENILDETESMVGEQQKFPVSTEELAEEYGDQEIDLPNETESMGSVFDRLEDEAEYDSREEVREAVYGALTGEAADAEEYNLERELEELRDAEGVDVDVPDDSPVRLEGEGDETYDYELEEEHEEHRHD